MAKEKLLDDLMVNLENDFRAFRKEISTYEYVIDLNALTIAQKAEINKKLGRSKYYIDETNNVLVLNNRNQFKRVEKILNEFKEARTDTGRLTKAGGQVSQERLVAYTVQRSKKAQAKLSDRITNKTKDYLPYASPEFVALFEHRLTKESNKYQLTFNIGPDANKELQNKLIDSVRSTVDRNLKNIKRNTAIHQAMEDRLEDFGQTFKTGKRSKKVEKVKEKRKSSKRITTKKNYYAPLRSASGIFINALSLRNTLNTLLHDTIERHFMFPSAAASSPDYLRYQTGRFAKSARVENVTYTGNEVLNIDYDYMTNPYETFKNGRKHGAGRNPENIISGAIRDILVRSVSEKFRAIIRKI